MIKIGIDGVGVVGPGIDSWEQMQQLFAGKGRFNADDPIHKLVPTLLPANERRRTTNLIKLAMQCGQDALADWGDDYSQLKTVFSSCSGDLEIVDKIMVALTMEDKPVSPTHFHNSVHNAPAGYWSIAAHSHAASTSISARDASFGAGLIEAATQVLAYQQPVLLIAYDNRPPPTLHPFRPLVATFAVSMLLTPAAGKWSLDMSVKETQDFSVMKQTALERMRRGNPSARALPLLQCLATTGFGSVTLPYHAGQGIAIEVKQGMEMRATA